MQIRYERPLPDLRYLVHAPLRLDLGDGRMADIEGWCPEGFVPPARLKGEEGPARIVVPFHQFEIAFAVKLRRDPQLNLMRFVDLGPREARVLSHFYREIVTGRAVSDGTMIASMDTPVEPVPMERTAEEFEEETAPRIPRLARAAAVLGLYVSLGWLVYQPLIVPIHNGLKEALSMPQAARGNDIVQQIPPDARMSPPLRESAPITLPPPAGTASQPRTAPPIP